MKMFVKFVTVALAIFILENSTAAQSTTTPKNEDVVANVSSKQTFLTIEDYANGKKLTHEEKFRDGARRGLENPNYFEGDIVVSGIDREKFPPFSSQKQINKLLPMILAARRNKYFRWPGSRIPYTISSDFSLNERAIIAEALSDMMRKTCFKFVDKTSEKDYIYIMKPGGRNNCSSPVGRQGGEQVLTLTYDCVSSETIQHEMMHAIGLFHEQSRADRDQYVEILWDNIKQYPDGKCCKNNFNNYSLSEIDHLGQPYDYYSIMHYEWNAFGINGAETIRPVPAARAKGIKLDRRMQMSPTDIKKLNIIGGCPNREQPVVKCNDNSPNCDYWAKQGYCTHGTYRLYMSTECQKSCKLC